MKRYTIVIRSEAVAEIRDAFDFIHADSPGNATTWLKGIWSAIDSLETMPQRCPFAREREVLGGEVRQFVYRSHRILFTVEAKRVVIYHVRHARMDSIKQVPGVSPPKPETDEA